MILRIFWVTAAAVVLVACGGSENGEPARTVAQEAGAKVESAASGELTRQSVVLCPALENHRDELASIIGFEQDAERGIAGLGKECIIRGEDGAFIRVAIPPAVVRSISMQASSYDGPASAAPELGADAVYIDSGLQPHVIFSLGPLIIDLDAENIESPDRESMIELALRVRELLGAAN